MADENSSSKLVSKIGESENFDLMKNINEKENISRKPPVPTKRKKKNSISGSQEDCRTDNVTKKRPKIEDVTKEAVKMVTTKPPLPPKPDKTIHSQISKIKPPIKCKSKVIEESNANLVQKLSALAEKLRLENSDLKNSLCSEKAAVRNLRALNESETRRAKVETKKLQDALQVQKKTNVKINVAKEDVQEIVQNTDCTKLIQEISTLKDANKSLEEKIQISSESERRKATDIREIKDAYEKRLTQITKSAKLEIHRLLEELKTKERCINQQKRELHSIRETYKKEAQKTQEMRKLKEPERNCNVITKKINSTTCGNDFVSLPHEIPERILEAHNELHAYRNSKENLGSDTDSALSSAPSSLSPQPSSCPNSPDLWSTIPKLQIPIENDVIKTENDTLKVDIESAKEQIKELEKALLVTRDGKNQQLFDKIKKLEQTEASLMKETHELREQNELLEFRIIELEESHDKWSLRSNTTPDTRDVWTDTEKESDDHTDSGITSPNSHHHLSESPCDLSIDNIQHDEVRKRLTVMSKRNLYDDDDKSCLIQVLSLLNNLEALSHDQEITSNDISLDFNLSKSRQSDYSSAESSPRSLIRQRSLSPTKRIVATVLPYSSTDNRKRTSSIQDSPTKSKYWCSTNLQESGVFEGDDESNDLISEFTQTDPEDFPDLEKSSSLCAEIQKLNKFRERIEECVTKTNKSVGILETPEQRRLQYYKERLDLLENKILIYESSGDLQVKRLAQRLQRELQLESAVKQLSEKVTKLQSENLILEEEKCEFEEAENDTRLRLQRLEFDVEIINQRNSELEMDNSEMKLRVQDVQHHSSCLERNIKKSHERISLLKEREKELKKKLELIADFMPTILKYNSYTTIQEVALNQTSCSCISVKSPIRMKPDPLQDQLNELLGREKELTKTISELNKAYNETLENADNLWAQMEKDYRDKLTKSDETKNALKTKLNQLEERLSNDTLFAQERISQLEESEIALKNRLCKSNRDKKEILMKYSSLIEELNSVKEEYYKLKKYLDGPGTENLEKERKKVKEIEEELILSTKLLNDVEGVHRSEISLIKSKLNKSQKELIHIEVTNSELKEEILTLETRIKELIKQKENEEENIRSLSSELKTKYDIYQCQIVQGPSLAQELNPSNFGGKSVVGVHDCKDLNSAAIKLTQALESMQECKNCAESNLELQQVAKDVKCLADAILKHDNERAEKKRYTTKVVGPVVLENTNEDKIDDVIETSESEISTDFSDLQSNFHPQNSSWLRDSIETSLSEFTSDHNISENSINYNNSFNDVHSNFHPQISENSFDQIKANEMEYKPDIEVAINSINTTSAEITEMVELLPGTISNIQISIEVTKSGRINVVTDVPFNSDILENLAHKENVIAVTESLLKSSDSNTLTDESLIEIPMSNIDKLILIINEKIPKCPKILMAESQLRELFLSNKLFEDGVEAILSLINNKEIENNETFENAINCIKNILKIYINLGLASAPHIAEELNNRILANYNPDILC